VRAGVSGTGESARRAPGGHDAPGGSGAEPPPSAGRRPPHRRRRLRRPTVAWIVGLAIGLGIVYVSVSSAGGVSAAIGKLATSRPLLLAAGFGVEVVSFALLAALLRTLLPADATRALAIRTALVVTGLGRMLPAAPAEGITMAVAELRRRGLRGRRVVLGVALSQWFLLVAALGLVAVNALTVAIVVQGRIGGARVARLWMIGGPALVLLLAIVLTSWLVRRRATAEWIAVVAGRLRFWRRPAVADLRAGGARWWAELSGILTLGATRRRGAALAVGVIGADVLCFACALVSVGIRPRPGALLVLYGAIVVSNLVPLLPAGVGAVETLVPALLHHLGTPLATGLAAVLVYRLLSTFLPAIAGVLAYAHLHLSSRPRGGDAPRPTDRR
jgi:uncharacterized membrane protein YbhN (UPF0104 family)